MKQSFFVLGNKISLLASYEESINKLFFYLNESGQFYITVNNVHTIVEALRSDYYKKIINESILSLPDGKPLSIYTRIKGEKRITRIFGPTFMEKALDFGQKNGIKHYFLGSSIDTLNKLILRVKKTYPHAVISGYLSPPFKEKFDEKDNELIIKNINKSNPDIIWIGLGAPKQELWMYENYKKMNHGVMIGIGAGFDYLAGNTKHAPKWMKDFALEWLFRLIQEPRRLWKRYLVTNIVFLLYVFGEFLGLKKFE